METIAKKVVQNWAAKGYISDDEVEMCLYNLIRHTSMHQIIPNSSIAT